MLIFAVGNVRDEMRFKICMDTTVIVAVEIHMLDKRRKAQPPPYWLHIKRVAAFQLKKG